MLKTFSEAIGLRRNDTLNPKLWDGNRLRPEVRTALLNFGEAWRRYAGIPESEVRDVIMVGGNAGYYYNEASDIDVHLLVDRSRLGMGPLTDDHLKDRKTLWSIRHDVRVKGYPVEPYAQDVSERGPLGQGSYSLRQDRWLTQPVHDGYDPEADQRVARKVGHWQRTIDRLVTSRPPIEDFDALKTRMAAMRSRGIARGGELDPDNLVFKALRLSGHLDKMSEYVKNRQVEDLSLREDVTADMTHEILTAHGLELRHKGVYHAYAPPVGTHRVPRTEDLMKDLTSSGWQHWNTDHDDSVHSLCRDKPGGPRGAAIHVWYQGDGTYRVHHTPTYGEERHVQEGLHG